MRATYTIKRTPAPSNLHIEQRTTRHRHGLLGAVFAMLGIALLAAACGGQGQPSRPTAPPATAPTESASSSAKMFGGIIVALIAVISTLVASR